MKSIPIKYHLLFWLLFIISGIATLSPYYLNLFKASLDRISFLPVWLIATYINLYVFMPKFWDMLIAVRNSPDPRLAAS